MNPFLNSLHYSEMKNQYSEKYRRTKENDKEEEKERIKKNGV